MIVFCGYANLDVVGWVPRFPGPDERVHARALEQLPGGMAANAAVAAARAGARTAFAGVVGADLPSDAFLAQLQADGVDTGWTDRAGYLSTAIVLVDGAGRRSVVSQDDALDGGHVDRAADRLAAAGGGLLYLDGYRAAELPHAARAGLTLAVDLDGCEDPGTARAAVRAADHVVVGRRRLVDLLGVTPGEWADLAATTTLVVTDGPAGWHLRGPGGLSAAGPALPVDVVDDTGAGDCFVGTHLAGLDAGLDPGGGGRGGGSGAPPPGPPSRPACPAPSPGLGPRPRPTGSPPASTGWPAPPPDAPLTTAPPLGNGRHRPPAPPPRSGGPHEATPRRRRRCLPAGPGRL